MLTELWRGKPVTFHGEHITVTGVTMAPSPLQQPRIPIWCCGRWSARAPFRRAARWDGVMATHVGYGLGQTLPPAALAAVVRYIGEHREDGATPLAVALEGRTDGEAADRGGRHVAAYRQAALTWWVGALRWWRCDAAGAMARIRQGPPLLRGPRVRVSHYGRRADRPMSE